MCLQISCSVLTLLTLYEDRKHLFNRTQSTLRHISIFNDIASDMRSFEYNMTGTQCKELMGRLLMRYRAENDNNLRTGSGRQEWPFFQRMVDIFGKTSCIIAPVCVSTGLQHSRKILGEDRATEARQTRTRPRSTLLVAKNPPAPSAKPSNRQEPFKTWYRKWQEKQEEEKTSLKEELVLTREAYERNSKARLEIMQEILAKWAPNGK